MLQNIDRQFPLWERHKETVARVWYTIKRYY